LRSLKRLLYTNFAFAL